MINSIDFYHIKIVNNLLYFYIGKLKNIFGVCEKNSVKMHQLCIITHFVLSSESRTKQAENHDDDDDENHVLIKKCVIGRQKELGSSQMRGSRLSSA